MILHVLNIIKDFRVLYFVKFINSFFKEKSNIFVISPKINIQNIINKNSSNFIVFKKNKRKELLTLMHKADKIIMHGVHSVCFEYIYYMSFPQFFEKTFCILLSGDFYYPYEKNFEVKWFLKNVKHVISFTQEEYELTRIWYGTEAKLILSFAFPPNVFTPMELEENNNKKDINILLGHAARREYRHIELIKLLEKFKHRENIKIYSPLSYDGDNKYINEVIEFGKKIFGERFIPMTKFLPLEEYNKFLSQIDIAIFGHCQSAAMGNIINLLGFGKKVYLRKDSTLWPFFKRLGVKVFDIENINLKKLTKEVAIKNKDIIKKTFSLQNLVKQWNEIFNS